jgi:hypothetical protein
MFLYPPTLPVNLPFDNGINGLVMDFTSDLDQHFASLSRMCLASGLALEAATILLNEPPCRRRVGGNKCLLLYVGVFLSLVTCTVRAH